MKSASQSSSEIRKAGSLTFAGIIFYCAHILQQAHARDAQVGVDVTSLDMTEVDSAESLSDQSSTLVAELKDSPLNDTEIIATADLSVVQVADNDDDVTQGKDTASANDQSDGGISPIFLVGTTVLIGVGALLINNDENNNSSSPSEVTSSEPYDFHDRAYYPFKPDDVYSSEAYGVGVAQPMTTFAAYHPWGNVKGGTYRDLDGHTYMTFNMPTNGVMGKMTVHFPELAADVEILPLGLWGILEYDPSSSTPLLWHYLDTNFEPSWASITYDEAVMRVFDRAIDRDFIGNHGGVGGQSLIWVASEDPLENIQLDIIALDYAAKEIKIAVPGLDMTGVELLEFTMAQDRIKMVAAYEAEAGDSVLKVAPIAITEIGELNARPGLEYVISGQITDIFAPKASPLVYAVVESDHVNEVHKISRADGVEKMMDLSDSGFESILEADLNKDGFSDLLLLHRHDEGYIDMFGSVMSEPGGGYGFAGVSLPATLKLQELHAEPVIESGEMLGAYFIGDGDLGPVEATLSIEALQTFGPLTEAIRLEDSPLDLNSDNSISLAEIVAFSIINSGNSSSFPSDWGGSSVLSTLIPDYLSQAEVLESINTALGPEFIEIELAQELHEGRIMELLELNAMADELGIW